MSQSISTQTQASAIPISPTIADFGGPSTSMIATTTHAPPPPELEQTLAALLAKRSVLGVLLLSRASPPSIIRHSGVVFEGEAGKKYAKAMGRIVDACKAGLEDVGPDGEDDLRFLRLRTKRHELLISPDDKYLLVVLQDPTMTS